MSRAKPVYRGYESTSSASSTSRLKVKFVQSPELTAAYAKMQEQKEYAAAYAKRADEILRQAKEDFNSALKGKDAYSQVIQKRLPDRLLTAADYFELAMSFDPTLRKSLSKRIEFEIDDLIEKISILSIDKSTLAQA